MILIGVAGGSGSGKSTFARELSSALATRGRVLILEQDSYYRDQSANFDCDGGRVNFDHPSAIEWPLLVSHLQKLKAGQAVDRPVYDFSTHKRRSEFLVVHPVPFLILDGILILLPEELRRELDFKIFIHTPEDLRFERRMARDVAERGRTPDGVRAQFMSQVKPMHDQFVEPSRQHADYVIAEATTNTSGASLKSMNKRSPFGEDVRIVLTKILKVNSTNTPSSGRV